MHNNWWSLSCEFGLIAYLYNVITAFLVIVPLPPLGGRGDIPCLNLRPRETGPAGRTFRLWRSSYIQKHGLKTAIFEMNR